MKIIITWFFLVAVTLVTYSQVPDRYYDSAENLSGADLKDALYEVIKGHT